MGRIKDNHAPVDPNIMKMVNLLAVEGYWKPNMSDELVADIYRAILSGESRFFIDLTASGFEFGDAELDGPLWKPANRNVI